MQISFKTREQQARDLHDWALSRTKFVLRRVSWRVSHASVNLSDLDGPRHGIDKRCQVSISALDAAPVVVTATARDWRSALNQALTRAAGALRRLLQREKDGRRSQRLFIRQER
jgi:hypothetical protein